MAQAVEHLLLFARRQGEIADHQVAGHKGAGFAREHGLKNASEAFHPGETGNTGRYGKNDEEKFGAGSSSLTPGDSDRSLHYWWGTGAARFAPRFDRLKSVTQERHRLKPVLRAPYGFIVVRGPAEAHPGRLKSVTQKK